MSTFSLDTLRDAVRRLLAEVDQLDRAVVQAIDRAPTPVLDRLTWGLSRAADYSRLWLVGSAALAVLGGRRGRWAALRCLVAVGVTAGLINLVAKIAFPRSRPRPAPIPHGRAVRRPASD